jgi:hypothetical protein
VSCHRMSPMPSPLKSPVPLIDHWVGTLASAYRPWVASVLAALGATQ